MTSKFLSRLLIAPVILTGCAWSNTVWLVPPDQKTESNITVLEKAPNNSTPAPKPFALVEAKAIKSWDSPGDLLGSNIKKSLAIGGNAILCPTSKEKEMEADILSITPSLPTKEEVNVVKDFLTAITELIKAVIALPMTARTHALSEKTLLCAVYRL